MERLTEIDQDFYSFSTGQPFERCIECDRYLLNTDTDYFIEKAIKKYEGFSAVDVVFEYALCLTCAEKLRNDLSKESMATLQQFFMENVNFYERAYANQNSNQSQIDRCLVSGSSRSDIHEYQIFAQCRGSKMVVGMMPYMICGQVLEEVSDLLSEETRDELDNFGRRHFGPPPELAEPLPYQKILII